MYTTFRREREREREIYIYYICIYAYVYIYIGRCEYICVGCLKRVKYDFKCCLMRSPNSMWTATFVTGQPLPDYLAIPSP